MKYTLLIKTYSSKKVHYRWLHENLVDNAEEFSFIHGLLCVGVHLIQKCLSEMYYFVFAFNYLSKNKICFTFSLSYIGKIWVLN